MVSYLLPPDYLAPFCSPLRCAVPGTQCILRESLSRAVAVILITVITHKIPLETLYYIAVLVPLLIKFTRKQRTKCIFITKKDVFHCLEQKTGKSLFFNQAAYVELECLYYAAEYGGSALSPVY